MKFLFCFFLVLASSKAHATPRGQEQPAAVSEDDETPVPEPSEKAMSYYKSGNLLWIVNQVWSLLIPGLFLFTGFSAKIRNWATRVGRKWFFVIGIYFIIFSALNFVIDLPLSYYQGFVREHAYGLSNQTIGKWWGDSLKNLMVGMILGFLFLWVVYLFLEKAPRRWWLYTGLATVPFLFFFMLIAPVWIDPLFNKFGSMKDKELERKILDLAERAGIEGGRGYEVNKSVDTKAVNAYVTGFMDTKRIVLWDTILAKLNEKEILVVMGHEMGHYVLGHVIRGVLFFSFVIMLTLYAAHRLSRGLIDRYKGWFGFDRLADIASLPLILLLVNLLTLIVLPFMFGFTRYQEHEADRFALEITGSNHAAAMAFVKLQEENLVNPRPGALYKLWRASHPTVADRIDFCNQYRPWKTGQPLKYGDLFKTNRPSEK
jgi:Zn-dependent protease with chaperone function